MKNYRYCLRFETPVRFGTDKASSDLTTTAFTANADTLFGAIANEWVRIYGEMDLLRLVTEAEKGAFLISDLLPYKHLEDGDRIFIPKPTLFLERKNKGKPEEESTKKKMKKITHLGIDELQAYHQYLLEGGAVAFGMDPSEIYEEIHTTKVSIPKEGDTLPYHVAGIRFYPEAGLCFLASCNEEEKAKLDEVMDSLSTTGIGGKRSAGFGKFQVVSSLELGKDPGASKELDHLLKNENGTQINISSLLPKENEVEQIKESTLGYQLILRKGFVASAAYAPSYRKRKQVVMLKSGSTFTKRLEGQIADVSDDGAHKVYRYGKGMYLGVNW